MSFAVSRRLGLALCLVLFTQACSCGKTTNGNGDGGDGDGALGDGGNNNGDGGNNNGDAGDGGFNADVPVIPRPDVHVLITADNAYGFGYGTGTAIETYFMGVEDGSQQIFACSEACGAGDPCSNPAHTCDIFGTCNADRLGPETYVVPGEMAKQDGYLYIVVWSDESFTQGLIGQFRTSDGANTVYTGDNRWEVCATGDDVDPADTDPTLSFINSHIVACNAGVPLAPSPPFPMPAPAGPEAPSNGWLSNAFGNNPNAMNRGLVVLPPANDNTVMGFTALCRKPASTTGDALDAAASWMWYDDDVTADPKAFNSNGATRGDFLIFRLPISTVIIID